MGLGGLILFHTSGQCVLLNTEKILHSIEQKYLDNYVTKGMLLGPEITRLMKTVIKINHFTEKTKKSLDDPGFLRYK